MPQRTAIQLLHFHPRARRSMEVFQISLAEELMKEGWRTIHVVSGEPGEYFRSELQRLKLPYLVTEFPLTYKGTYRLSRQLRLFQPTVLHTAFLSAFDPHVWALKKLIGARWLIIEDQSSGVASIKHGLKSLIARTRAMIASSQIDHVVAVSDFVRNRDIHGVHLPAHKVRTIHNAVEVERFRTAEVVRSELPVIAFIGQLIPEKGVLTLLQAISDLKGEGHAFKVLLAGQGAQEGELRRYCKDSHLDCVEFLGQIDWVPRFLASADIVVIPSEWEEAFGFTVAEAMAAGACVLASDAGGIPEIVGRDGSAGTLFRKGDRDDLKSKLIELLTDPPRRQRLGAAARERAQKSFSLDRMVQDYARLYAEIAGN